MRRARIGEVEEEDNEGDWEGQGKTLFSRGVAWVPRHRHDIIARPQPFVILIIIIIAAPLENITLG